MIYKVSEVNLYEDYNLWGRSGGLADCACLASEKNDVTIVDSDQV